MKIIDLCPAFEQTYFHCLEDYSDEIKEAGSHKENWYNKMKDKGLRVKLALDNNSNACGMIQYIPIEYSTAEGKDLYFILCIWIHGHKKGVGNHQKRGMGKALLKAAEEDVIQLGKKGIAAWGLTLPFFMRASWFIKNGYARVDKEGIAALLWKKFSDDAVAPKWIRKKKSPDFPQNEVQVTAFINGWCPAMNMTFERAKRASYESGEKVKFKFIDTSNRENFLEYGISDAVFVNEKQIKTGPPPSYKKIKRTIDKKVKKIKP